MTAQSEIAGKTPIVLLGSTASGKSGIAMELARESARVPGGGQEIEIISADSMCVYEQMDIGTAKPTTEDQSEVPHWCLDLIDPAEEYTVSRYQQDVAAALENIQSRGVQPLIVGGTGLYIRAIVDAIQMPGQFPEVRASLEDEGDTATLYTQLCDHDPLAAKRMEPTNRRRIVRALEVTLGSGRRFSSYGEGLDTYGHTAFRQIGLRLPRPQLDERIEQRFAHQLELGLVDEAWELHTRPEGLSRTARQALAYKELFAHFRGEFSLEEAIELAKARTRRFSRRQERWFRRDPRICWIDIDIDIDQDQDPMEALPAVRAELEQCLEARVRSVPEGSKRCEVKAGGVR